MRGDSQSVGYLQSDIRELGSTGGERPIGGCRSQAGKRGANGIDATEGRACKGEAGTRHSKKSDRVLCAGISVKYAWIERHKSCWPVIRQCEALNVSTSGYFGHQGRRIADDPAIPGKYLSDAALLVHIRAVHAASKGEYGWGRRSGENFGLMRASLEGTGSAAHEGGWHQSARKA